MLTAQDKKRAYLVLKSLPPNTERIDKIRAVKMSIHQAGGYASLKDLAEFIK